MPCETPAGDASRRLQCTHAERRVLAFTSACQHCLPVRKEKVTGSRKEKQSWYVLQWDTIQCQCLRLRNPDPYTLVTLQHFHSTRVRTCCGWSKLTPSLSISNSVKRIVYMKLMCSPTWKFSLLVTLTRRQTEVAVFSYTPCLTCFEQPPQMTMPPWGVTDIWQPDLGVGPVPAGDSLLHVNVSRLKAYTSL